MGQCLSVAEERPAKKVEDMQPEQQQQQQQLPEQLRRALEPAEAPPSPGGASVYLNLVQRSPRPSTIVQRASQLRFTPNVLAQRSASSSALPLPLHAHALALAHQGDPPPPPPRSPLTFHYYNAS
jgi:hypothetical protein